MNEKNVCHHSQKRKACLLHASRIKKETNLIICKFKHVQTPAICNRLRAKIATAAKCPADRALCVKANKLRIQKMLYSKSGCNAMT